MSTCFSLVGKTVHGFLKCFWKSFLVKLIRMHQELNRQQMEESQTFSKFQSLNMICQNQFRQCLILLPFSQLWYVFIWLRLWKLLSADSVDCMYWKMVNAYGKA